METSQASTSISRAARAFQRILPKYLPLAGLSGTPRLRMEAAVYQVKDSTLSLAFMWKKAMSPRITANPTSGWIFGNILLFTKLGIIVQTTPKLEEQSASQEFVISKSLFGSCIVKQNSDLALGSLLTIVAFRVKVLLCYLHLLLHTLCLIHLRPAAYFLHVHVVSQERVAFGLGEMWHHTIYAIAVTWHFL